MARAAASASRAAFLFGALGRYLDSLQVAGQHRLLGQPGQQESPVDRIGEGPGQAFGPGQVTCHTGRLE